MSLVAYQDEFAEGKRHTVNSFREVYERFSNPSANVEKNANFDTTRAMMLLQVLVFY